MNPTALIRGGRIEAALLMRVLERAADYRLALDKRLARLIVTEYAEATKRGRRR